MADIEAEVEENLREDERGNVEKRSSGEGKRGRFERVVNGEKEVR